MCELGKKQALKLENTFNETVTKILHIKIYGVPKRNSRMEYIFNFYERDSWGGAEGEKQSDGTGGRGVGGRKSRRPTRDLTGAAGGQCRASRTASCAFLK